MTPRYVILSGSKEYRGTMYEVSVEDYNVFKAMLGEMQLQGRAKAVDHK